MTDACQLYLISPPALELADFLPKLEAALETGYVPVFQLRLKDSDDADILRIGKEVKTVCHRHDTAFILNDRPDLAATLEADGVHLGKDDGNIREARRILGDGPVIGASCYDSKHRAMLAGEAGADYVAFGAFYPTTTKIAEGHPEPDILRWWQDVMELPCVAIGGINAANAAPLVKAGADFLAVVSAVWQHPKGPAAAVNELAGIIAASTTHIAKA